MRKNEQCVNFLFFTPGVAPTLPVRLLRNGDGDQSNAVSAQCRDVADVSGGVFLFSVLRERGGVRKGLRGR